MIKLDLSTADVAGLPPAVREWLWKRLGFSASLGRIDIVEVLELEDSSEDAQQQLEAEAEALTACLPPAVPAVPSESALRKTLMKAAETYLSAAGDTDGLRLLLDHYEIGRVRECPPDSLESLIQSIDRATHELEA